MRVFRIENGWVVEKSEGDLHPKAHAFATPVETLKGMLDWFSGAGIGAANKRKIESLKQKVEEVLGE